MEAAGVYRRDDLNGADFVRMTEREVRDFAAGIGASALFACIKAGELQRLDWGKTMQMAALLQAVQVKDLQQQLIELRQNTVIAPWSRG